MSRVPEEMKEPSEDLIYYCYICNCRQMKCSSLKELNDHMDQCLSRQAVRELVKSQNEELSRSSELPTTSLKQIPLKGISPKTPVKTKPK